MRPLLGATGHALERDPDNPGQWMCWCPPPDDLNGYCEAPFVRVFDDDALCAWALHDIARPLVQAIASLPVAQLSAMGNVRPDIEALSTTVALFLLALHVAQFHADIAARPDPPGMDLMPAAMLVSNAVERMRLCALTAGAEPLLKLRL
ncbi:hypothetical protein FIV34_12190 [Luteibacter pinisoli]|uniref:Uncharacterized protein n=1 Tax=Luteibacter pinisoli TaxID=2589080 RepID=A0A4Y5Z6P9_9GAMM|nr:hypothetical protein [Luteibacter pinisoli]QDE39918.1 hypothetical protein FIV34_12190 [Luteibacter pinisoli]